MPTDVRRRAVLRAIGLAPLATLALACTIRPKALLAEHPLAGTLWDLNAGRRSSFDTLLGALRASRFRLLGEVHDNPDHHAVQLKLLDALGKSGLKPVLAFEQFDRAHDKALRERQAADSTAEEIAQAVQFNRKGWNWDYYRPLVETALRYRMPLRAANLSRADASRIAKEGLGSLGDERVAELRLAAVWSAQKDRTMYEIIFEGHCRALPERFVPGMVAAQRARDATLADALLGPAPDGAVLIAGNGHVRRALGVPIYLRHALPDAGIVSLGLLEVEAGKNNLGDYFAARDGALYDFAWFTPQAQRDDPCKALAVK